MRSIRRAFRFAAIVLAIVAIAAIPAASTVQAADKPDVVHQQFAFPGADLGVVNICGDLADFHFSTEGSFTSIEMGDGVFHLQVISRGTYTVTFLDTTKGVWDAVIRSTNVVQATPGGTFIVSQVANTFEGPVRIHETTTYVLGADGALHVDRYTFDFVGCP